MNFFLFFAFTHDAKEDEKEEEEEKKRENLVRAYLSLVDRIRLCRL